jgi:type III secretory pathway component EscU
MFWSKKPITEHLVMERVYAADVIERGAIVSAKPQVAVDAYLSGGVIAVFVTFIIYGALAQLISVKAEKLFGGYVIGTALIYSGLFQMLWRGLTFEFLVNSVFWSLFTMFVIFKILKGNRILKKIQ